MYQWYWELEDARVVGHNLIVDGLITVIGTPHGDTLLAGFVKLQQMEARLILKKILKIIPLLRSD